MNKIILIMLAIILIIFLAPLIITIIGIILAFIIAILIIQGAIYLLFEILTYFKNKK